MTDTAMRNAKLKWVLIGALCGSAITLVIYFSLVYPWPTSQEAQGTMGGVQKVERYRSQQMSEKDVKLRVMTSAEQQQQIQKVLQKIDYQKLLKTASVQKATQDAVALFLNNPGMQNLIKNSVEKACLSSGIIIYSAPNAQQNFGNLVGNVQNVVQVAMQTSFSNLEGICLQNAVCVLSQNAVMAYLSGNQAMQGAIADPKVQELVAKAVQDNLQGLIESTDVQKAIANAIEMNCGILMTDATAMNNLQGALQNGIQGALAGQTSLQNKAAMGLMTPQLQNSLEKSVQATFGAMSGSISQAVGLQGIYMTSLGAMQTNQLINSLDMASSWAGMLDRMQTSMQGIVVPR